VCKKFGNKNRLFSLLNFPRATILNFYDVKRLPLLLRSTIVLFETIGQPVDVIKIQNGRKSRLSEDLVSFQNLRTNFSRNILNTLSFEQSHSFQG